MDLQAAIVQHLRHITEPCNVVELAHALGILEPGDVVPDRLRATLTGLVRHQRIKRLHHGDGVLRYALVMGNPAPAAPAARAPAAATQAPAASPGLALRKPHPANHRYETGVSARVLAVLQDAAAPIRRTVIESRITPPLSSLQVTMALQALRKKGLVQRHGTTSSATWSLAGAADAPAAPSAPPKLDTVRHALLQARLAVDAALQALEA